MSAYPSPQDQCLSLTPFLEKEVEALENCRIHRSFFQAVRQEGQEANYTRRIDNLGVLLRDLDTEDSAQFLMAAARMALTGEVAGLRTLFACLNVRRSGVEVLKRLQVISSIERVSLQLLAGTWVHDQKSESENPAFSIMEVLKEAGSMGMLEDELGNWPHSPETARETLESLRRWIAWLTLKLAAHQTIPKKAMDLITQICLLEISLTELRVSKLAEKIDPYDMQAIARLMPVLSRYDQNIDMWKTVISKIHTYVPFSEQVMTLEAMINDTEMNKIEKVLRKQDGGQVVARLLRQLREKPILDRELLCLVSATYQTANLCALNHPSELPPVDLISAMLTGMEGYQENTLPPLVLPPHVMESTWPILASWGLWTQTDHGLVYRYSEKASMDFINADGTPVLDPVPGFHEAKELSIEDLVLTQLGNDAFLLGLLDNAKALQRPTVVSTITMLSRSVRVLSKIATSRHLHTGVNNKDVPRLLLGNPSRVPIPTLRRFIHVRFVSRTDLLKMGRANSDLRPEVRKEIQRYIESLKGS